MSERTQDLLNKIKEIQAEIIKFPFPITLKEKEELIQADATTYGYLTNMKVEKRCATCAHCAFYDNVHRCAARDMAPIPFEVANRAGGCSKWDELDLIPF